MIPRQQNPSCLLLAVLLHLHFFYISGAGAVNFTILNNCSQTIWAMVVDNQTPAVNRTSASGGDEVRVGSSITIQLPNRWSGRVWGKTGCSAASCASMPFTLAEFSLNSTRSLDLYDVSLVDGYNLPLLIQPNSSGCESAYSYPKDDENSIFTCPAASRYTITFCPHSLYNSSLVQEGIPSALAPANSYPLPGKDNAVKSFLRKIFAGAPWYIRFIILCFRYCIRYSENVARKCNRDVENLLLQHGSLAPKRYRYSEIKKATKSLRDKLGHGGYGSVYKGTLPDGRLLAVKILAENDTDGEAFLNEVVSISKTSHVNIVTLLGFCYEGHKRALVYEFMPNSSLDKFLTDNDCLLDLENLYKIAVGIAKGLEYLHTGCTTRIVHFDIKPQNILLDEEFCPKISDFGLAKLCKKKQSVLSVVGIRGTVGYIAPEVFSRNFGGVSYKSDVYSYGMMLLEMAEARKETQAESEANQSSENYFPDKIYEQVMLMGVTSNELMKEEEERRKKLFLVGFWCIQTSPSDRPSMSKVVVMLEGSVEAIQTPPKPFLFSPPLISDQQTSSSSDYVQTQNLDNVV